MRHEVPSKRHPEQAPQHEYRVLNDQGEAIEVMQLAADVGDMFYVEEISDSEQRILPYKHLVHTEDGWGEETQPGTILQIREQNIRVGHVDREKRTVTFTSD